MVSVRSNLVVTLTMDGYIIKANENFCKLVGCTEGDMVKKPHSAMVTPNMLKVKNTLNFGKLLEEVNLLQENLKELLRMVQNDGYMVTIHQSKTQRVNTIQYLK
jgi:PAS domain-containing protein